MLFFIWFFLYSVHFYTALTLSNTTVFGYFIPLTLINSTMVLIYLGLDYFDRDILCGYFEFVTKLTMVVFFCYYICVHHTITFVNRFELLLTHWIHAGVFFLMIYLSFYYNFQQCYIDLNVIFLLLTISILTLLKS